MKKASFIIGLIGSILGIIGCAILLFNGFNMLVTEAYGTQVMISAPIGLIFSIAALVGACISNKKVVTGILMLVGAIGNIPSIVYSVPTDNKITFIICVITMILLFISGIMRLCEKE